MSYCRWSSDDYQCDVYVWEDCAGGWRTEVAGRRHHLLVETPPAVTLPVGDDNSPERSAWATATVNRMTAVSALVADEQEGKSWEWRNLPAPRGGGSYWHDTPDDCADNLEDLRAQGFNVPQYAIDALRAESAHGPDECPSCGERCDACGERMCAEYGPEPAPTCGAHRYCVVCIASVPDCRDCATARREAAA